MDSNVLIYAAQPESVKTSRALELLFDRPVISVQVLNEFVRVATGKMKMPIEVALLALIPVRHAAEIVSITLETHDLAMKIAHKHKVPIFDANIIAAAQLSGCDILYTEDLNHGQKFGRVSIVNPFMAA